MEASFPPSESSMQDVLQKLLKLYQEKQFVPLKSYLQLLPNELFYEEALDRLQDEFQKENRQPMRYGDFRFIVHEGRLQSIVEFPKNRRYRSRYSREHEITPSRRSLSL